MREIRFMQSKLPKCHTSERRGADDEAHAAVGWRRVLKWPGGKLTDLPSSAFEIDGHRTGGRLGRVHDREAPTALDAHTGHLNRRLRSLIRPTPEQEREDAGAPLAAQRRRAPEALDDRLRNRQRQQSAGSGSVSGCHRRVVALDGLCDGLLFRLPGLLPEGLDAGVALRAGIGLRRRGRG